MYGLSEKVFITGLVILFFTIVIGGVFMSQVAVLWFKNKREERKHDAREREADRFNRWERERGEWLKLVDQQNARIDHMNEELVRLTRDYENAKTIMAKVNLKGAEIR